MIEIIATFQLATIMTGGKWYDFTDEFPKVEEEKIMKNEEWKNLTKDELNSSTKSILFVLMDSVNNDFSAKILQTKILWDEKSLPLSVFHIIYETNLTPVQLYETIESGLKYNYRAGNDNWKLLKWDFLGKSLTF
jgi:hypothetical protein